MTKAYTGHLGFFDHQWKNPPAPFNPAFDPKARGRFETVSSSMERDGYYTGHTREECKVEWARRYEQLKAAGK